MRLSGEVDVDQANSSIKLWEPEVVFLQHALEQFTSLVALDAVEQARKRNRARIMEADWLGVEARWYALPEFQVTSGLRARRSDLGVPTEVLAHLSHIQIRRGLLARGGGIRSQH